MTIIQKTRIQNERIVIIINYIINKSMIVRWVHTLLQEK